MLRFSASRNAADVGSIGVGTGAPSVAGGAGSAILPRGDGRHKPQRRVPDRPPASFHSGGLRRRPSTAAPRALAPRSSPAALASVSRTGPRVSGGPMHHLSRHPSVRLRAVGLLVAGVAATARALGGRLAAGHLDGRARRRGRPAAVSGRSRGRPERPAPGSAPSGTHRPTWRPRRQLVDRLWERGRVSMRTRVARVSAKRWQIAQCAVAAGVAWLIAADLLGHPTAVLRAGRGRGEPRHVVRPAAAPGRRGDRRRRAGGAAGRPARDPDRLGLVAADPGGRPGDDVGAADHQRPDVRHPGGGAVDHHLRAGAGPVRRAGPLERRGRRGLCRAGGGHRGAGRGRCAVPREQAAIVVRKISAPAARRRRGDGRRGGRAGPRSCWPTPGRPTA